MALKHENVDKENRLLRLALAFYGNKKNYERQNYTGHSKVQDDGGQRAREVLGKR
ncbi:hypothetical protein [Alicyclobacillus fodiniaquatilis]|uniref:Uncharacterized protein n=1 Tax=Alicyclobacillus fodiniaquatilis TaxID=1661150 RepID=A0ABW4JJM3_9BACL